MCIRDRSKLARRFERIRSIIRKNKRRRTGKEKCENEQNLRLEELVKEVISQKKETVKETVIDISLEQSKYVNIPYFVLPYLCTFMMEYRPHNNSLQKVI